jgi:hypothetical protein
VPGILTLLATGYVGIGVAPAAGRLWLAALFGIGAALTLDEFALWLNLKDVYGRSRGGTASTRWSWRRRSPRWPSLAGVSGADLGRAFGVAIGWL